MNNQKLSKVIDTMRLPLIFLVIIAHLVPFTLQNVNFSPNGNDLYVLFSEMFSHHIAKLSVRCYFLVSGYYFFNKYSGEIISFYKRQCKSRLRTLVRPYIIWNLVMILAIFSKNYIFSKLGWDTDEIFLFHIESDVYRVFWAVPINFPLWFVRDLICMVIISPLILYYIRYFKHIGIIFLGILYMAAIEPDIPGFSMSAIFFFSLGAYFSLEKKDLLLVFNKLKYPALIVMLMFLVYSLSRNGKFGQEHILRIFIVSGVITIFNLFSFMNDKYVFMNRLTGYSSLSFFIYVIHEIYVINWLKGFFYNLPMFQYGWGRLIIYFTIPIVCITICTGLYSLLMKLSPKLLIYSLGGRLPNYNKYQGASEKESQGQGKIPV